MNTADLIRLVLAKLADELDVLTRGAKASFAAATDPDSKAENKYDTRTLEASYVARGQAQRVEELRQAVQEFRLLLARAGTPSPNIGPGSLFKLQGAEGADWYLMGPAAGGTAVTWEGREVLVITPSSPLGRQVSGLSAGSTLAWPPGRTQQVREVL